MSNKIQEIIDQIEEAMKTNRANYELPNDAPTEIEDYLKQVGFCVVKLGNSKVIYWK